MPGRAIATRRAIAEAASRYGVQFIDALDQRILLRARQRRKALRHRDADLPQVAALGFTDEVFDCHLAPQVKVHLFSASAAAELANASGAFVNRSRVPKEGGAVAVVVRPLIHRMLLAGSEAPRWSPQAKIVVNRE